ncbi:MAG: hypothetical protein MRY83_14215, partial [Flavobacteriales bacterium]|nr:hypothetical protein [Flavobacteriales bacterium]
CEVPTKPAEKENGSGTFLDEKPIYAQKAVVDLTPDSIINFTAKIPGRFLDSGKAYIYFYDKIKQDYIFIHGKGIRGGHLKLKNYSKKKITEQSNYFNVKISFSLQEEEITQMDAGRYQVRVRYTNSPLDYGDYRNLKETYVVKIDSVEDTADVD